MNKSNHQAYLLQGKSLGRGRRIYWKKRSEQRLIWKLTFIESIWSHFNHLTHRTDTKARVWTTATRGAAQRSVLSRLLLRPEQVHFPRHVLHLAHLHHHTAAVQGGLHDRGHRGCQWSNEVASLTNSNNFKAKPNSIFSDNSTCTARNSTGNETVEF